MAGLDLKWTKDLSQAIEFLYGFDKEIKGNPLQIPPMLARTGLSYKLSDSTSIEARASIGKSFQLMQKVDHKHSDALSFSVTQKFNSEGINKKAGPYQVGFNATYKL